MRPQDPSAPQPLVRVPNRDNYSLVPSRTNHPGSSTSVDKTQHATAAIARRQIDEIYADDPNSLMEVEAEPSTHSPTTVQTDAPQPTDRPNPEESSASTTPQIIRKTRRHLDAADGKPSVPPAQQKNDETEVALHPALQTSEETELKPQYQPVSKPREQQLQPEPQAAPLDIENPYQRTHDDHKLQSSNTDWKQYHSAWQQYYQQYFHRYYASHIEQMHAQNNQPSPQPQSPRDLSPEEAMDDIRSKLREKIYTRAKKVRKSRHFVPIAAALGVMLVFTFLQYNRVMFSNIQAYVTPGTIQPSSVIVDPTVNLAVGPEPKLIIPKVNIDVPVEWDTRPDHESQMKAMEQGVAWFGIPGANSKPGQIGNTVISGHSSNDWLETGNYKFVFAPLHRLVLDDTIYINYEGTRYTYVVTDIDVVKPTDVDALRYETDKPMLTLITCTPLGTALNRLLITAEQVSPSLSDAKPSPDDNGDSSVDSQMPGFQPTVIERMFGADR